MEKEKPVYEMKERLLLICDDIGISANKLSSDSGKNREYIRQMKDFISSEFVRYLSRTYPQYSIEWLITGEGTMKKEYSTDISTLVQMLHEEREKVKLLESEIERLKSITN